VERSLRNPQRRAIGKLKAVARRWAESRQGGRDELDDDLRAFDLADQIKEHQPVGIWPENELTVRVFFAQENQWREAVTMSGTARRGLDHGQIKHTLELLRVKKRKWPKVFNGLKTMETEALKTIDE